MNDQTRPNPDQILARLTQNEGKPDRGRLKIFFGSSAGVGKTYAMLTAAHEHKQQGLDVVVGIVETHKRQETADLLNNLSILPPLEIKYRGLTLKEFDLDNYLFGLGKNDYFERDLKQIEMQLRKEMKEIFYGRNTGSL